MSYKYFENFKYEYSQEKFKMNQILLNLRKQLHVFEFTPLKNKNKVVNFQKDVIFKSLISIKNTKNEIKGFNLEAFTIGVVIPHTIIIFKNKVLLNEMGKKAIPHIFMCLGVGVALGILLGNTMAKSFGLYREYNKTLKCIEKINKDYEYYYLSRHEEVFDE